MTLRIAMWSGPRNISTAMMRAWEHRPDTRVTDEPLYAFYLARTGAPHPGAQDVLASQPTEWEDVVEDLVADDPDLPIHYQKHMAHHLLPEVGRSWLTACEHCFLLRDPREMLLSLRAVVARPGVEDTGLPQQYALFEELRRTTGRVPPVLDARDVLMAPEPLLRRLCAGLGVPFLPEMLSWPPGRRASDGVWAPHWYASVERSTGFEAWRPRDGELDDELRDVHARCMEPYTALWEHRLTA
jgi:hypothetical protein